MRTWCVYEVRDQRTDTPFYIGMTGNVASTMARHWGNSTSAAAPRCSELRELGYQLDLRVLSTFDTREAALEEESRLICSMRGLVNRTHKPKREPLPRFVILLSADHRAKLELIRFTLGLRSEADAIRYLIDAPGEVALCLTDGKPAQQARTNRPAQSGVSPTKEHINLDTRLVQLGPAKREYGARLKKGK